MNEIIFQKLTPNATLPTRAHPSDAGLDLYTSAPITAPSGGVAIANTGIAVNIPHGYVGEIHIRSGMAFKHGITLGNATGIIDAGYAGEIKLLLHNFSPHRQSFPAGTRMAQIIIKKIELPEPQLANTLPATERGTNGFGSTGE